MLVRWCGGLVSWCGVLVSWCGVLVRWCDGVMCMNAGCCDGIVSVM